MQLCNLVIVLLLAAGAWAQTTSITGTIKDVTGTPVTTGKVSFQLMPGADATIYGVARYSLSTTNCKINQPQISTISRSGNVVTATLTAVPAIPFAVGDVVGVSGVADSSYNASQASGFTIASVAGNGQTLTWNQTAGNSSSSGGNVGGIMGPLGTGVCTVVTTTSLTPAGFWYKVTVWPLNVMTSQFTMYAVNSSYDLSTIVATPTTGPPQNYVDVFSNQSIGGNKTFTGNTSFAQQTIGNLNGVLWVGSGAGQYASLAACYAAASSGQTCAVTPGWADPFSSSLIMNKNNVGFVFMGAATITMGSNQVIVSAGTAGAFMIGYAPMFSTFGSAAVQFNYTGTGTAFVLGASGTDTNALRIEYISVIVNNAGSNAIAVNMTQVHYGNFTNFNMGGAAGSTSQIGLQLNGGTDYVGDNTFSRCQIINFKSNVQFNFGAFFNLFQGGVFNTGATGGIGLDFEGGIGNIVVGADIENTATAVNFGGSSLSNRVSIWLEANTTDVAFGALALDNYLDDVATNVNSPLFPVITDAGTSSNNNQVKIFGSSALLSEQGSTGAKTGNASDQVLYTYTLPGRALPPGRGIRIRCWFSHSTGTASVTYKTAFGSGNIGSNSAATTGQMYVETTVFNNSGVLNAQHWSNISAFSSSNLVPFSGLTTSVDTTANVVINFTFNVANTDQVTGEQFIVDLVQ